MNSATPPPISPPPPPPPPPIREPGADPVGPAPASALDYASTAQPRTRWLRLGVLVVIALILAAVMPRMWNSFGYRVGRRSVQREMTHHTVPPGTVAYGPGAYQNAPFWQSHFGLPGYFPDQETTLFVHQRTSARGTRRIVGIAVMHDPPHVDGAPRPLRLRVAAGEILSFASATSRVPQIWSDYASVGHWPAAPVQPTFFFGQPDPVDASRVTIAYTIGDASGTIEGRLNDDETVTLVAKDGPLSSRPTTQAAH